MAEVAGVVIRGHHRQPARGGHQAQAIKKFADVLDLVGELLALGLHGVVPVMAIILEHRPAAGHVDDHGIDVVEREGVEIGVGKLSRRFILSGMEMDGAATRLFLRHDHVAAVLLQDPRRGPIGGPEDRVAHATGKQRHAGPPRTDGRQESRQRWLDLWQGWQHLDQLAQTRRQQLEQTQCPRDAVQSQCLRPAGRRQRCPHAGRIGKQSKQDPAVEPIV